jgi:hypothetical protein
MVGLFVYEPVRGHFVYMGHRNMQDHESHTSTPKQSGKARWHAPVLKRLDVDLTAGNARTSNEPPTRQTQFGGGPS